MLPLVYFQHGTTGVAWSNRINFAEGAMYSSDVGWNERNKGRLRQVKKAGT